MEIVISIVAKVAVYLVAPVVHPFTYCYSYKTNFENLNNEVKKLKKARDKVKYRVDHSRMKGKEIQQNVQEWLISVDEILEEVEKVIEEEERSNNRCFNGLCPNLKTYYKLSKKAVREVKVIAGLKEEGKFDKVSYHTVPEEIWLTSNQGYMSFKSRKPTFKEILNALSNPDVNMIGVYGMGGIGKTTLVKKVASQAMKKKIFYKIVSAYISQTPDVKKIQVEIAEKLGLELKEQSETVRAARLYERLKKEKKILVILDDIWGRLDMEIIGIPLGNDDSECKVLLTARSQDVLSDMDSQQNFTVGVLEEKEALSLFKKTAGDCIENVELKSIATDVAKKCAGLPIAIVTVARALRDKSLQDWRNALRQLRRPSWTNFTGIQAVVYSSIELSYNHLEDEEIKLTFLLCSLMRSHASILDLLKYGVGLGLFLGVMTMEEARDRVYTLVNKLKSSCLLLDGSSNDLFSMHDVVREVALSIASRDHHALTITNDVFLREWTDKNMMRNCTAISLHDINTCELPEGELECPQLKFFLMNVKDQFINIPDNFFAGMIGLRTLALSGMRLLSLPSSLGQLVILQTLCLVSCILRDIAIIGDLKQLEILSFRGSNIKQLVEEIGHLTRLRLLDLSNCSKLKVILSNVISSLSQLEELYVGDSIIQWTAEGLDTKNNNASLDELKHLSHLTTLEIRIQDAKTLPKGLFSKKLERYRILLGRFGFSRSHEDEYSRMLSLNLNRNICLEDECIMQLKGIEAIHLENLSGFKNVLYDLNTECFPHMKKLEVENCRDFLCIVQSMKSQPCDAFPILEFLFLRGLNNLENIFRGRLTGMLFCKLRIIKVLQCDKLKKIFPFSIARVIQQLQTIEVTLCKNMEEIFASDREDGINNNEEIDKAIELVHLRSVCLRYLPQLKSFYKLETDSCSNEIRLEDGLEYPNPFFNEKIVFPNLEDLQLFGINFGNIWRNQFQPISCSFQNLTRLMVNYCHNLKYVFPSSLVRSFQQLQHLEISQCSVMEVIVAEEEGLVIDTILVFPRVTFLSIWHLPELNSFYPGIHSTEWPALKQLKVYHCDKAKIFTSGLVNFQETDNIPTHQQPLFFVEKVFPHLEELTISAKGLRAICQGQFPEELFRKLKVVEILDDESTVFSLGLLQKFYRMKSLILCKCSYKEIFSNGQVDEYAATLAQIKRFNLRDLSDLKYLWRQDSKLDSILQNLKTLKISRCKNLIDIVPSSASFQNLTTLKVWFCDGLIKLVTSSTAKTLVWLQEMDISACKMMTEIVENEGDLAKDEIVFRKMKKLSLDSLESLSSFSSGNYSFNFPSLEVLSVKNCPNMKIFSRGVLSTTMLQKVHLHGEWNEGCWEGDINKAIQKNVHNFEEDSGQPSSNRLE